jgi:uncharacterized RDD family membrane protein YckC
MESNLEIAPNNSPTISEQPGENAPTVATKNETKELKAGFIVRNAAFTIDTLIVMIVIMPILFLLSKYESSLKVLTNIFSWGYFLILTAVYGTTPGKRFYHLKVVKTDGSKVNWVSAFLREIVGRLLSGFVFGLGFLWVIWDKNKQGWHDKIASTYVVVEKPIGKGKMFLAYFILFIIPLFAIFGIIASVVLVSINPSEQMERAKDAGRKSGVLSLGHAIRSYYNNTVSYPSLANWDKELIPDELPKIPSVGSATDPVCKGGSEVGGYCYNVATINGKEEAIVYALLTSKQNKNKCVKKDAYFVYSTLGSLSGISCGIPLPGTVNEMVTGD